LGGAWGIVGKQNKDPTASDEDTSGSFERLLAEAAKVSSIARANVLGGGDELCEGRFTIRRSLGEGGMGVVYEAWDRTRHGIVALKTLSQAEPRAIYYLKNEFRSVADIVHPNLVTLHEFFQDEGRWFFTMEAVRGTDFKRYVAGTQDLDSTRVQTNARFNDGRLRDALAQLVSGVAAIHAAGKLHCDLKPSNVMVEPAGRVVVLDFGLVNEQHGERIGETVGPIVGGTPAYMAPEQAGAEGVRAASDMYAVGVMLFEALTRRLPFEGPAAQVLASKQMRDAPKPSEIASDIPNDLDELCTALLARRPEDRPTPDEVLKALGPRRGVAARTASETTDTSEPATPFVGRTQERTILHDALAATRSGAPRASVLVGPPGIGKTRLLHEFLREAEAQSGAVTLQGLCHERESIPFNAFDRIVDALSRHLRRLDPVDAAALLPRDALTLARLFPVLGRVRAVVTNPGRTSEGLDPFELRRRGFAALRDLLARFADVEPLVLAIDDLQWADEDSLRLLRELVRQPDPPAMLIVATLHDFDADNPREALNLGIDVEPIELSPLDDADARQLVESLAHDASDVDRIVEESGGSPFFLAELSHHLRATSERDGGIDAMIAFRSAQLSPPARRVLEVLSLAERAMDLPTLYAAADLPRGSDSLLSTLRNEHWLRAHRGADARRVELYHRRVGTILASAIEPERARSVHQWIARALERANPVDHERLAEHWLRAGEPAKAASSFIVAAQAADESCAFGVASRLYARAIEHGTHERAEQRTLYERLGDAQSRAGRGNDAARAYLTARELESDEQARTRLARLAAQHFLAAGELDAGTDVLRNVLQEAGVRYPETPTEAERASAELRANLDLDALDFTPVEAKHVDPGLLARIDVCCAAGPALGSYDFVRSGYYALQGLALALQAGEPRRVARTLSAYSTSLASSGALVDAQRLAHRALTLAREHDDPELIANGELALGQVALFEGDFERALQRCDAARTRFRNLAIGASLEIPICDVFSNMALYLSGGFRDLVTRSREQLVEACDRGHHLSEASLRAFGVGLGALLDDDIAAAREHAHIANDLWPQDEFHGERFKVLRMEAWCDLYEQDPAAAAERMTQASDTALASRLLGSRYWRFWWLQLGAHVGIAAAAAGLGDTHADAAARAIEELDRDRLEYAEPTLLTYRAGLAKVRGDTNSASDLLTRAARIAHPVLAAAIEHEHGRMLGDTTRLDAAALRLRDVCRQPERLAPFLVPGVAAPTPA
jgi:serine/threonine protein kinase